MSLAQDLLSEMATWRAAWRQIETFLDRVDETASKDEPHARRVKALLRVVAYIELERKWRDGSGLNLPLEMARAGDGPPDVWEDGEHRRATADDAGAGSPVVDQMNSRLPGLFDVEIAAAALSLPSAEEFDADDVKDVRLVPPRTLFERYDADKKEWVDVRFPVLHVDDLQGGVSVDTTDQGLFPLASRRGIVVDSLNTELAPPGDPGERPEHHPRLWSALRGEREPPDMHDEEPLLESSGDAAREAASTLKATCDKGAAAANEALKVITEIGVGPVADVDEDVVKQKLAGIAAAFELRSGLYEKIADGRASSSDGDVLPHLTQPVGGDLSEDLEVVLDEAVDAQIAYPDGTLRQRRTLEWTFLMHYTARLPWFWHRRDRALRPLLLRFLRAFRASVARVRGGAATQFPFDFTLSRPAAVGDASLQLTPPAGGLMHDLGNIVPGQIAHLEGDRSTLALILGVDPPLRADGKLFQRLRISPLRVSLATGKGVKGSSGMIPGGARLSGRPAGPSDAEIRAGASSLHPERDGVIVELVSLWTKLCLLLGTTAVETHPSFGVSLPSPLPRGVRVPVQAPVAPASDRVLVRVKDLENLGFDARAPHVARPGEMLLLRGRADDGDLWQTAVEVRAVVRVAEEDAQADLSVVSLEKPVCCEGPGELIAVLITDPRLPVELVKDVALHRDFRGFGAPSLSSEQLLPKILDPDSSAEGEDIAGEDEWKRVYRGPELDVAVSVLKHWLGDRMAP